MAEHGSSVLLGVLGWPIHHSLSPVIHKTFLENTNVAGRYVPLAVHPDNLGDVIAALPKMGFAGVNLTVPHKEALALCSDVSDAVKAIGAVNTLSFLPDGAVSGHNTDADGFYDSLRPDIGDAAVGDAVVIGAGGGARAVVYALLEHGAQHIHIANRTEDKAEALRHFFNDPRLSVHSLKDVPGLLKAADLSVNTTSCGLNGENDLSFDFEGAPPSHVAVDIVYAPLETGFLRAAAARGLKTVDGLGMLIGQAALSFERWTGVRPDVAPVRPLLLQHLKGEV